MNSLSPVLLITAAFTLAGIMALGVFSGKKVKNAADFDTGGNNAGAVMVAGTLVGTLVGGSSTIGTAQLAFLSGLSAWWFTLGSALGCVLLGLGLCKPLRTSGSGTIQEIISREYGGASGVVTSILTSVGIVINIVAQILAANALLATLFGLSPGVCAALSVVIMASYVLFGGIRGAGLLGVVKMILIYLSVLICGFLALKLSGGLATFFDALPRERYFNLFSRGAGVDLGAGLSVALGVVSTQTYVQAILVAKSDASARRGALLSAAIIPPVGILSIFIGYHMRLQFPGMPAGQAFPRFIIDYLPPSVGGVFLATLLIAIVGTGSGMALGFGRIVTNDIYKRYINPAASGKQQLRVSRIVILASLVVSALFTMGNLGSVILTFGFLSMGLRAAVLLVPMLTALFLPGRMRRDYAIASSVLGLAAMLVGEWLNVPFDSLFLGIAAGAVVATLGLVKGMSGLPAAFQEEAIARKSNCKENLHEDR